MPLIMNVENDSAIPIIVDIGDSILLYISQLNILTPFFIQSDIGPVAL